MPPIVVNDHIPPISGDHLPPIVVDNPPPIVVDNPPPVATAAVAGTISFESGLPYAFARVRAVDRQLRQETTLADGAADAAGNYRLTYQAAPATRAGGERPDLVVQVLDAAGATIASSDVRFDAPPDVVIDVTVPAAAGVEPSEFDRVKAAVEGALQGTPAVQVASADLAYLAGRTGEHPSLVATYAAAAKLADATGAPPALYYGLLRSDLPNSLPSLLTQGSDLHPEAIETAIARNLIPTGTETDARATLEGGDHRGRPRHTRRPARSTGPGAGPRQRGRVASAA